MFPWLNRCYGSCSIIYTHPGVTPRVDWALLCVPAALGHRSHLLSALCFCYNSNGCSLHWSSHAQPGIGSVHLSTLMDGSVLANLVYCLLPQVRGTWHLSIQMPPSQASLNSPQELFSFLWHIENATSKRCHCNVRWELESCAQINHQRLILCGGEQNFRSSG